MSRWFVVPLMVACLFVFVQGFPQDSAATAAPTAGGTAAQIESALSEAMASLQKGLKDIMDDPQITKLMQDGQKLLQNAATSIQTEAAKMMPKTDGK